jgi:hypothetical protein
MTVVIKLFPRTHTHTRAAHYGREPERAPTSLENFPAGRAKRRRALKAAANAFRVHHLVVRVTSGLVDHHPRRSRAALPLVTYQLSARRR